MSAKRALVVSSGMAALDVISRLLKSGDEVLAGDDVYGGMSSTEFEADEIRNESTAKIFVYT
jgi:cystathionine beta-lyase/cystathionine gamma-synthase